MPIGFLRRRVSPVGLSAPYRPFRPHAAREKLQIRARRAGLDDFVLLVRLAAVLAFAGRQAVHLPASGRERAGVFAAHAEQHDLGDVPEREADAPAVGAAIFAHLVPDEVQFILEAPASSTCTPSGSMAFGTQR